LGVGHSWFGNFVSPNLVEKWGGCFDSECFGNFFVPPAQKVDWAWLIFLCTNPDGGAVAMLVVFSGR
jgi:hypothetical protein